jgi:SAM-dependent methyltransferase
LEGLYPSDVFDRFVLDFADSLKPKGIEFVPGRIGYFDEGSIRVGRVTLWNPPNRIEIDWHPGSAWNSSEGAKVNIIFEPLPNRMTNVTLEIDDGRVFVGDGGFQLLDWFVDEILSPLTQAISPNRFASWLTDRRARRPSGEEARATYRNPTHHLPNFKAILHYLQLNESDYLLEVGCGGGAFLLDALKSGCRAAAVDHSPDMVRLAREVNSEAIARKHLEISQSEADSLPYPNDTFTCAVSTGVLAFIERPVVMLSEIHRVLRAGGRLALFTDSKELKGTPAAPEPIASQSHFYDDEELVELACKAGFNQARVERPDLEPFAREAGLNDEMIQLFSGPGLGQLLLAKKPDSTSSQ